jgi:hypothetical protein
LKNIIKFLKEFSFWENIFITFGVRFWFGSNF